MPREGSEMRTIPELLSELHAFEGLPAPHLDLIAGCGRNAAFRDGELLLREGEDANVFYAIREGDVALEVKPPERPPLIIETLHPGDVLGWSWLFEPYRVRFDARALGTVHAIAFDGACLRGKCDEDHDLGYEMMSRFAQLAIGRLQATRIKLLDLYGEPASV
jgi:CRP/FNR family transcriptional regulator, cyclic AMP receptor protein